MPAPYSVFHRLVVSVSCSHMRCPVGALRTPHLPASAGPFLRPKTYSGAGMVRSEPWRRTANPQSAQRESRSSLEPPQRVQDRSRGPKRTAEREWSAASLGGGQQTPHSAQRESRSFPRAYSASAGPFPRSPLKDINIVYSVPFCVNRWDRPPGDSSGAVSGRSEPWRRTTQPPSAQRESSSSSEPTQRAEARCRAALNLRAHQKP